MFNLTTKRNKPTAEEKARAKKFKKQRKELKDDEELFKGLGLESYDPVTGEITNSIVTKRDWIKQRAREEEAELAAIVPHATSVHVVVRTNVRPVISVESTGNTNVTESNDDNDVGGGDFDGGDDLFDEEAYQQDKQIQMVNTWESLMSKLVKCYFKQLGRLGEPAIATSFVKPFSCEDCEVPFEMTSNIRVYFFNGKHF